MSIVYCDTRDKKNEFAKHCVENKYSKILIVGEGGVGKSYSSNMIRENMGIDNVKVYYEEPYTLDKKEYQTTIYHKFKMSDDDYRANDYDIIGMYVNSEASKDY